MLGPTARLVGMLETRRGRPAEADAAFAEGVGVATSLRSPTWIARTRLDWAEALLARGETDRAAASVDAARDAIGELDLADSARRVDALTAKLAGA